MRADDRRVPAEAPPPEPVAQHGDAVTPVHFVVGGEGAAHHRMDAEHVEEPGGHALRAKIFRFGAWFAKRERPAGDRRDRLEDLLLRRPIHVVLGRGAAECLRIPIRIRVRPRCPPLAHRDQPIVLVKRQAAKDDGVHHRKDRRAGADPEHQDEQGNRCERLGRLERAERGFQIITHDRSRRRPNGLCWSSYLAIRAAVMASPSSRRSTASMPRVTRPSAVKSPSLWG